METKNTLQRITRYFTPAVLAGAITLGGCGRNGDLPVNQETLQTIVEKEQEMTSEGNKSFNKYISDGYLTIGEQEVVYGLLRDSRRTKSENRLYTLLNENLHGYDLRKPSLQKVLEKQGLNTTVERKTTTTEWFYPLIALFGLEIIAGTLAGLARY